MKAKLCGNIRAHATALGGVLLVSCGMASALFGLTYTIHFRTPFPFRDMVETMEFLDRDPSMWLGDSFTRLHDMEHRPALPAFVWYADRVLSGSSGLMPLLVSHVVLALVALLAVRNWAPRISWTVSLTWLVPTAALAMMFSLINWYNLVWEKQLHVAMSLLFLVIAAHWAARLSPLGDGSGGGRALVFAAFASWAAKFSFGYGLPTMPVITIHGLLARWPRRYLVGSAIFSVIFLLAYSYFYSLGGQSLTDLDSRTFEPFVMIAYMARLLAGAVAATNMHSLAGSEASALALIGGLALFGFYLVGTARQYWRSLWLGQPPSRFQTVSLIVTSACVAIAFITWLSRPEETLGLVERYYVVSTLFILSLPGLFVSAVDWSHTSAKARLGLVAFSCVLIMISLLGHLANYTWPYVRWHVATIAAIGADIGIHQSETDAPIGLSLHQWKTKTFDVWAVHRRRLIERTRYEPFAWRGRNVDVVFDVSSVQKCFGNVESVRAVAGYDHGYVFVGWARTGATASANADWIVATDATGEIIGLGAPGRRSASGRKWLDKHYPERIDPFANQAGIAGFLSATPGTEVHFLIVKGRKGCKFSTSWV